MPFPHMRFYSEKRSCFFYLLAPGCTLLVDLIDRLPALAYPLTLTWYLVYNCPPLSKSSKFSFHPPRMSVSLWITHPIPRPFNSLTSSSPVPSYTFHLSTHPQTNSSKLSSWKLPNFINNEFNLLLSSLLFFQFSNQLGPKDGSPDFIVTSRKLSHLLPPIFTLFALQSRL
jgi:hypothetical protein